MKLHPPLVLAICFATLPLIGCQSYESRQVNLDEYLQRFIGSNRSDIQNNLDFNALGYQTTQNIQTTATELSYTILRPINIPIAGSNASIGSNAMGTPMIRYDTSATPSYDINFNCKVTFKLKHDIAQSIQYSGKAC